MFSNKDVGDLSKSGFSGMLRAEDKIARNDEKNASAC